MKKVFRFLSFFLTIVSIAIFSLIIYGNNVLPDNAKVLNSKITFSGIYTAEIENDIAPVSSSIVNSSNIKLFGTIPVKNINISKTSRKYVAVGGELLGIRLKTKGVLVVGTESFECADGIVSPAEEAGLLVGDTLISINGKAVSSNNELGEIIAESDGNNLELEVLREGQQLSINLTPKISTMTGLYKGGLWIRDSTGGIGTLTFVDLSTGTIGALGHGIYDVDTSKIIPTENGAFMSASLSGVTKGTNGTAGELRGSIGSDTYGDIYLNCENGIYGTINYFEDTREIMPVALPEEIKTGSAQIISTVEGNKKDYYDIEIEKIYSDEDNKNMILKVTDPELLDITGGIVQGMSGSPIIQNDKIIGAVTHVFLNDPTKGYGIFIENMLDAAA
ncbi:MAG: SpoIVB peptidase [Clostridia bacterium]|nr:SpoIVB peptidase [Clostridia bacterium]